MHELLFDRYATAEQLLQMNELLTEIHARHKELMREHA
jgi:hypothetical protein